MGRSTGSRLGAVLPKATGSPSRNRRDGRLDPVRWRRPATGMVLRLAVVVFLLCSAALVSWSSSDPCGNGPLAAAGGENGMQAAKGDRGRPGAQAGPGKEPATPSAATPGGISVQPVPSGSVGVPVRLADPAALALVQAGNRVDLLLLDESGGGATPVAGSALVLQVTRSDDPAIGGLLLALTPDEAKHAVAGPGQTFAVLIRPG
ncbi:hypothetical protein [Paractinoplanes brasiliensis]|uniref:Uncharacterized protein n=1 Tax=Paractinoplanes brasiliensis TaxID=52695 RepID=A0A4R6JTQ8_9ACTN|nr:hypothetical protein [Actinoplanes brasiliensis]TDO40123.1 hypothetical protein C8E87_3830 [Actinoplanes brasiliensis]GID25188.1 hypothetical protein Abr02nite_01710 [Actinoplanes brasiliensis]